MVSRLFRDDAEDTGETEVRELRARFGAMQILREDPNEVAEAEIESELMSMVEAGELIFGWIEERQEFGFWFPEEPVAPPVSPVHHRRKRPSAIQRNLLGIAATVATLFSAGVVTSEAMEHHSTAYHLPEPAAHGGSPSFSDMDQPKQAVWSTRGPESHAG